MAVGDKLIEQCNAEFHSKNKRRDYDRGKRRIAGRLPLERFVEFQKEAAGKGMSQDALLNQIIRERYQV